MTSVFEIFSFSSTNGRVVDSESDSDPLSSFLVSPLTSFTLGEEASGSPV